MDGRIIRATRVDRKINYSAYFVLVASAVAPKKMEFKRRRPRRLCPGVAERARSDEDVASTKGRFAQPGGAVPGLMLGTKIKKIFTE